MFIPLKEKNMTNFHHVGISARTDFSHFCSQNGTLVSRHQHFVQCCCWNTTKTGFPSAHQPQLALEGGGEGSAWHLLFTFQATVESSHGPSREACVHLFHPCVQMPAQRIQQLRVPLSKCPHTRTRKPACRCNYLPDKVPDLRPSDSAERGPRRAVPAPYMVMNC